MPNKKTTTTEDVAKQPKKYKRWIVSGVKVTLALAFLIAGLDLAGYVAITSEVKLALAALNGITGIWILLSNVR